MGAETGLIIFFMILWLMTMIFLIVAGKMLLKTGKSTKTSKLLVLTSIGCFFYPAIIGFLTALSVGILGI